MSDMHRAVCGFSHVLGDPQGWAAGASADQRAGEGQGSELSAGGWLTWPKPWVRLTTEPDWREEMSHRDPSVGRKKLTDSGLIFFFLAACLLSQG